jgi:acyl dehydratase
MSQPSTEADGAGASEGRDVRRSPQGLLFDEFEPGQVFGSGGRTVTEADIVSFAGLSGDYNPLHTDEEYALGTPFRGRIAHGLLVQSVASGLANQTKIFEGTIAALQEMIIRFRSPVFPGDTVHMELTVAEKEPKPNSRRGWIRFDAAVKNQRDEVVIDGEWLTLMLRRRPTTKRRPPKDRS